jgi:hypothetical protein
VLFEYDLFRTLDEQRATDVATQTCRLISNNSVRLRVCATWPGCWFDGLKLYLFRRRIRMTQKSTVPRPVKALLIGFTAGLATFARSLIAGPRLSTVLFVLLGTVVLGALANYAMKGGRNERR